mmetsp:Transcript_4162/g.11731  ORF Transcript_4162/g.11731 Transcript_4162/m.11731 type:complete len:368 (-) Transcript_4162:545-1648(-)
MEDTDLTSLGAMGNSNFMSDDLKEFLWDGSDMDLYASLSGGGVGEPEKDVVLEYLNPKADSSDDENLSKRIVMAEAAAAGLHKGGLRRAAFSMGDLQALNPQANVIHRVNSSVLETVPEGVVASMPQVVQQQPLQHQHQIPLQQQHQQQHQHPAPHAQQYILVPIDATGKQVASHPNQLASLSIEEIEAQLRRTREAATVRTNGPIEMHQVPQTAGFYQVAVTKPEQFGAYTTGPILSMAPAMSSAGTAAMPTRMAPPQLMQAPSAMLRRSKSAVELRTHVNPLGEEDKMARLLLKDEGEDGPVRVGKLTPEERREKILRYRQKRHARNFKKKIKYVCRKTLADSRPRVRGRFARTTDEAAKMPVAS